MSAEPSVSRVIGFWRTVGLLLRVARRRSSGRFQRQQQLLNQRTGSSINTLGIMAILALWALMSAINAGAAYVLYETVSIAQNQARQQGKIVVSSYFLSALRESENAPTELEKKLAQELLEGQYELEARRRSEETGETEEQAESFLRHTVNSGNTDTFTPRDRVEQGFSNLNLFGP